MDETTYRQFTGILVKEGKDGSDLDRIWKVDCGEGFHKELTVYLNSLVCIVTANLGAILHNNQLKNFDTHQIFMSGIGYTTLTKNKDIEGFNIKLTQKIKMNKILKFLGFSEWYSIQILSNGKPVGEGYEYKTKLKETRYKWLGMTYKTKKY